MRRTLRTAAPVALVAALAGCAGTSVAPKPAAPEPGSAVGTAVDARVPAAILDLPFTASDGRVVHLRDFAGKVVAISDVMTLCQETCPLDTATFVATDRAEAAAGHTAGEEFLSVTVDPERDTTTQLAAYRTLYAPPPTNWLDLTGTQASVDTLWSYLGVWRQKVAEGPGAAPKSWRTGRPLTYDIQHSDEVFFLDGRGHERFVLEGPPYAARGSVPAALYTFMDGEGHADLAHPPSTAWTETQARQVLASLG